MNKKNNTKISKVNVVNENFDMSAVANAQKMISSDDITSNDNKIVRFKLFLTDEYYNYYNNLLLEYASKNQVFNLSTDSFFTICIQFLKAKFSKENYFLVSPDAFHKNVTRPGKRKKNDRYVSSKNSKCISFIIDENVSFLYTSLMFSYISKFNKDTLFDQKHSRGYFFFDFVDILIKDKKMLFKFLVD